MEAFTLTRAAGKSTSAATNASALTLRTVAPGERSSGLGEVTVQKCGLKEGILGSPVPRAAARHR